VKPFKLLLIFRNEARHVVALCMSITFRLAFLGQLCYASLFWYNRTLQSNALSRTIVSHLYLPTKQFETIRANRHTCKLHRILELVLQNRKDRFNSWLSLNIERRHKQLPQLVGNIAVALFFRRKRDVWHFGCKTPWRRR